MFNTSKTDCVYVRTYVVNSLLARVFVSCNKLEMHNFNYILIHQLQNAFDANEIEILRCLLIISNSKQFDRV